MLPLISPLPRFSRHSISIRLAPPYKNCLSSLKRHRSISNSTQKVPNHVSVLNTSRTRYAPLEDIEHFERYAPGGYYPVRIGERFSASRYRIVHKLGFGTSSTIWLARGNRLARYIAVKFAAAGVERPRESGILRMLRHRGGSCDALCVGEMGIPEVLDEFEVKGPKIAGERRTHCCMVVRLGRMSDAEARDAFVSVVWD